MKQKSVGLTLRALIIALALILVAGSPALPPFDGVAYAQSTVTTLSHLTVPGSDNLQLDWTAVSNADSYRLWKAEGIVTTVADWGNAPHATIDDGSIQYVDTDVTAGMTYSYVLEAYDGDTRLGYSNVLEVIGTARPTAKPILTLTAAGLDAITIEWTAVPGATHYRVRYWHSGLTGGWMDLATERAATEPRSLSHTDLTPGTRYYYIVRGENVGGNGPYSRSPGNYDSLTLEATDTVPTLSSDHVSRQVVELSWTATSTTATYNLERKKTTANDNSGGTWEALTLSANDQSDRTYTDSNATYDSATPSDGATRYHYRVQALENGTPGQYSNIETVTIPETGVRPVPPTALATAAGSDAVSVISVSWTATPGTTSEIRWKTSTRDWSTPMTQTSPYNHTGLSAATTYTYTVRARNVNGPSLWSAEVPGTTAAAPATGGQMPKVMGLTVTDESTLASDGSIVPKIKLTWNPVSSATHYDIRRFQSGGTTTAAWTPPAGLTGPPTGRIAKDDLDSTTSPSWEDEDSAIAAATTYYYVVSAVNENETGEADDELGAWSDHEGVTTIALSVGTDRPTGLATTVAGPTTIWLSWTAVTNATSYSIQWRPDGGSVRTISDVTGTTYYHSGLNPNTEYLYRVRAENANSMTPWSDPEVTGMTWRSGLQPPMNVKAEDATTRDDDGANADAMVKVSWTKAAGATGYILERWDPTASPPAFAVVGTANTANNGATSPATATSQTEDVTDFDTTYRYRVRTVSATDMSAWSPVVMATTDPARPDAPALAATTTGTSMIRLSWTAVSGATEYKLEAVEGIATDAAGFATPIHSRTLTGNVRHYVHTGLKAGTRYSYRLKAVLTAEVETVWSAIANDYTKAAKPDLTARAVDDTSIMLSWDPVPFVTDATPTVAGHLTAEANYRIERRLSGESTWTEVSLTGISGCTTDATMKCMVTDTGLTASKRYFYRIRATGPATPNAAYTSYWDYTNQYTEAAPN